MSVIVHTKGNNNLALTITLLHRDRLVGYTFNTI